MTATMSPDESALHATPPSGRPVVVRPVLDVRRPFRQSIPDSSVSNVRKVARLDARTHVIAARQPGGTWFRLQQRTRFTRDSVRALREIGISEVVLRRGRFRSSFPLGWLSQRE